MIAVNVQYTGENPEVYTCNTVEEAVQQARTIAADFEESGFWHDEVRNFWGRYGREESDYPTFVTITVCDAQGETVVWNQ